jgi:hypothetical protein
VADFYDISLELLSGPPAPEVTTTQMALCFSDTGCTTQAYPRVVMYDFLGDAPPPGWVPYATSGPIEALTCVNYLSETGYRAIQVNGAGTVSIEHYGAWATVTEFGDWISVTIRKNGTPIGTPYYWEDTEAGWGHGNGDEVYFLVEDEAVADGDYFDTYVEIIPGFSATWYYRKVGVPWNPSLKVWGTVTPTSGDVPTGDPIPGTITPTTTVSDTDPTVDDDETTGYSVGDVWVNETTDTIYVLVDATDGTAVWVVTGPAAAAAPTTADYLVGTAQSGLSAEIVVGVTPGGELGGTWASPTVDATHSGSTHLALGTTSTTAAAGDHAHAAYIGELLISDDPSTPLVFADILQNEAEDDLLYAD